MTEVDFENRFQVYVDSGIDIRTHPTESEAYDAHLKDIDHYVFFPRGTLMDIAKTNRDKAKGILEQLMLSIRIFENSELTADSLIAAATKAYYLEEERFEREKVVNREELVNQLIEEGSGTNYDGESGF